MIPWLLVLIIAALFLAGYATSTKDKRSYLQRVVWWIGFLYLVIFGVMLFGEILHPMLFLGRTVVWAQMDWQPAGPMALGVIILLAYYAKRRATGIS